MQTATPTGRITKRSIASGASVALVVGALTVAAALGLKGYLFPEPATPTGHLHTHGVPGPFFTDLLKEYVPRRVCMFHEPGLIWLHFISDILIALSYFSIPVALVYFVRKRRDLTFSWIFWMFATFIMLCGTTHLFGVWALWQPLYKLDGIVKLMTGLVSLATAIVLWPLIPRALAIPSPSSLEKRVIERTAELARANDDRTVALERLRLSQVASKIMSWDWEIATGRIVWSGPGELVYGFEPSDDFGFDDFMKRVHPEDRTQIQLAIESAFSNEKGYSFKFRFIWPDGSTHWLLGQGKMIFDETGAPLRMVGINQEISEQVHSENALRESEKRFRALAENITQFAWMADERGRIFWYNKRWFDYTGTTLEEMRGDGWREVHHPDHIERVLRRMTHSFETGEDWEDTFPLRGKDGRYRWFLSRAVSIRDERGKVTRWFGTNTDITEQREAEQALKEADTKKNEFLATLAHELRNPLAPIRNAADLLQRIEVKNEMVIRARDIITRQVSHMVHLIDDLLDLSRITQGKLTLRKETLKLETALEPAIESALPFIEAKDQSIEIHLPDESLFLEVDRVRIAQVISNLLSNASKYTSSNGKISISAERVGDEVAIRVKDNGIGISPEGLPRLFTMFSQLETPSRDPREGLGIGLALVKLLTEMHSGSVEAKSAGLGLGSEFIVRLPLVERAAHSAENSGSADTAKSKRRVLIVDDNRDNADSLAVLLRTAGHEIRTAYDGPSALASAEIFRPEIVLLDIGMPRMSGYEVAERLRQSSLGDDLLIVAMTGWGQDSDKRRSEEAGFDLHLTKPVDLESVEAAIVRRFKQ